jgi:hypothetical protein
MIGNCRRRRLFKRPQQSGHWHDQRLCITVFISKLSAIKSSIKAALPRRRGKSKSKVCCVFPSPLAPTRQNDPEQAAHISPHQHGVYDSEIESQGAAEPNTTRTTVIPELAHLLFPDRLRSASEPYAPSQASRSNLPANHPRRSYAKTPVFEIGQLEAPRSQSSITPHTLPNTALLLAASYRGLLDSPFYLFMCSSSNDRVDQVERRKAPVLHFVHTWEDLPKSLQQSSYGSGEQEVGAGTR